MMIKKKPGFFNKKYGTWDIAFVKWSVVAWVLFLITVWPGLRDAVISVHWAFWLVLGVLFMIKPVKSWFS